MSQKIEDKADAVVARIKTIARRRRQTVNEMLKKVIMGFVVSNYYSEEQVAELCEREPLAWRIGSNIRDKATETTPHSFVSQGFPTPVTDTKVGRNDPCPCGSGKKYKKCCGS